MLFLRAKLETVKVPRHFCPCLIGQSKPNIHGAGNFIPPVVEGMERSKYLLNGTIHHISCLGCVCIFAPMNPASMKSSIMLLIFF